MKKRSKISILMVIAALTAIVGTVVISAMAQSITNSEAPPLLSEESQTEILPQELFGGIAEDSNLNVTVNDYVYQNGKLLCVTVNNLNKYVDYSIDLKITYLDEDGNILGEETQSEEQLTFETGKNFVFQTDYSFADYYLETEKTVYSGENWKSGFEVYYGGMKTEEYEYESDGVTYTEKKLFPIYSAKNENSELRIVTKTVMVLFDNNGEVYDVSEREGRRFYNSIATDYPYHEPYNFTLGNTEDEAELASLSNATGFVAFEVVRWEDIAHEYPVVENEPYWGEEGYISSAVKTEPVKEEFLGEIKPDEELDINATNHSFNGGKVICVTVNNLNQEVNYGIKVKATYYDENGDILGSETQNYDQLVYGYGKNLVFQTDYSFARFTLETEKTVYEGNCWKTEIQLDFGGINYGIGNYGSSDVTASRLMPAYRIQNNGDEEIVVSETVMVIFDCNGNVYDVMRKGGAVYVKAGFDVNFHHKEYWYIYGVEDDKAEMDSLLEATAFTAYSIVPSAPCQSTET